MVYRNVLDVVGNTPMIELRRMSNPEHARVLVKYEGLNVGGSIKTRTALNMIEAGEKAGRIHKDTIIVEPTSGNQGIGLALIGAVRGYKTVIIMPDSVSEERRLLVKHYGAEVVLVHDDGDIGACRQRFAWRRKTPMSMCHSSSRILPIPKSTEIRRQKKFWRLLMDRSTVSAPASAREEPSPASVRC